MSGPPPGYDDPSVVPSMRLRELVAQLESALQAIDQSFSEEINKAAFIPPNWEHLLSLLRDTANELGEDYQREVGDISKTYYDFVANPSRDLLDHLHSHIERLRILLRALAV